MILVTGATGFVGRYLVARLLDENYRVRCLLTDAMAERTSLDPRLDVVMGSLSDDEILFQAMNGVHTVIHLDGAQWWGNVRELERLEVTNTRKLLDSARAARVGRIIILSHLGATPSSAYPLMRVKGEVEELVRTSGLAYTVIRTGLIFGEEDAFINHMHMMLAANPTFFLMPGRGEVVIHPLYIHDLIAVLVQTLERMDTVDKVIDIGGPEYITLADLVRTVMRVSGKQRVVLAIPPYAMRWLNRLSARFSLRTFMTPQWLDILATNRVAPIGNLSRYYDVRAHRLEDTLLTYLPQQNATLDGIRYRVKRSPRAYRK